MFYCKICGYATQNKHINWCNNFACPDYRMKTHITMPEAPKMPDMCPCEKPEHLCKGGPSLAFAAVPNQQIAQIYSPEDALRAGTIFPELDMPWKSRLTKGGC